MAGGNGLHERKTSGRSSTTRRSSIRARPGGAACARVTELAVRDETAHARLDHAIGEMLAVLDEPLLVPQRVFAISGRKCSGL